MARDHRDSTADLSRRDVIKLGAAVTVTATLGPVAALSGQPAPAAAPAFFTPEEFALVDELSDMIIPADEHSPGARAAKAAAYIDARLDGAWDDRDRARWRDGLGLVDRLAREATGTSFLQASPDARLAILMRMAQNEARPEKPEELFFADLKARVVHAYYTSEIGIHQEMEYKGNRYLGEFVGFDVS